MTEPESTVMSVWEDHKGDGDVFLTVAAARPDQLEVARQAAHDFVIDKTGDLRAGPVTWVISAAGESLPKLRELDLEPEAELLAFLAEYPDAQVVIALVATDAPAAT